MAEDEFGIKQRRVEAFLDRHGLDGVLLQTRANFAWITCGRDNHVANNTPIGVASILAFRDGKRVCLADAIESPRMRAEELVDCAIDVVEFPWFDKPSARKTVRQVIAGRRMCADVDLLALGLGALPPDFAELRWSLTESEIARYRDAGARASVAMESACRAVKPGMSGHEIAGALDHCVHANRLNPIVTLIAVDEEIERFRHPIPTERKARRCAMLVTCAESHGLIANLTRLVHFGPVPNDLRVRHQAACRIDAIVNLSTKPGQSLGDMLDVIKQAYADNGFPDEWKLHHQGGPTGYATRDALAEPGNPLPVLPNQAFAWNPSITGTKSEDTILCRADGIEFLTCPSGDWPTVAVEHGGRVVQRADILVV